MATGNARWAQWLPPFALYQNTGAPWLFVPQPSITFGVTSWTVPSRGKVGSSSQVRPPLNVSSGWAWPPSDQPVQSSEAIVLPGREGTKLAGVAPGGDQQAVAARGHPQAAHVPASAVGEGAPRRPGVPSVHRDLELYDIALGVAQNDIPVGRVREVDVQDIARQGGQS